MGMSIYYSASRDTPLSVAERSVLEGLPSRYPTERLRLQIGYDRPLEGLDFYDDLQPPEILAGSTGIFGDIPEQGLLEVFEYWLGALAELRLAIVGAAWDVRFEAMTIPWFDEEKRYSIQHAKE